MTNAGVTLVVMVAYAGIVLLSMPLALASFLLAPRRGSFGAALRSVGRALGGVVLLSLAVVAVAVSPGAALWLAGAALAEALVLVGFPLFIGRRLVARWTGCSPDEGLEFATLGLPSALVVSLVLFLLPGGSSGGTIAFSEGPVAVLAWSAFVLVVSVGPAVAGAGLYRLFGRL